MSRKSRANAQAIRLGYRLTLAAGVVIALALLLVGCAMLSQRQRLTPITREEAISITATLEEAVPTVYRDHRHSRQKGYRLEFSDHERLYLSVAWQRGTSAPIELPRGTVCSMLVTPHDPDEVLALSANGETLISFEEGLGFLTAAWQGRLRGAWLCFIGSGVTAVGFVIWYVRRLRHAPAIR